ncbi:hypothetical protein QVD17_24330 [Tagetes erecta]|uniref:Uncharacterized protein n=1 Tax=Tagetes erecta TaxID=13708 RepID=A0AAD8NMP7_TARER|nr:hypothetical protein QVD17_24330 [Tagetes erecta]
MTCMTCSVCELSSAKNLCVIPQRGVVIEDKKLLSILFLDGCDGRIFILKTETYMKARLFQKKLLDLPCDFAFP